MFYDFSLCPGGAMMMHESVAEYDPTAAEVEQMEADATPMPEPEEVPAQEEQMQPVIRDQGADSCPVAMMVAKLSPCYEAVHGLLTMQLNPEDSREAVESMDQLSEIATIIAETMRMLLVKQHSLHRYITAHENAWAFESVRSNLGFLIQNYKRIINNGYNQLTITTDTLPLLDRYTVGRALDVYLAMDELPQYPFDISKLIDITSWEKNQNVFTDTEDMLNTIFHDPDRLARLSQPRTIHYDLDGLIANVREEVEGCVTAEDPTITPRLVKYISKSLRRIKQECYRIQCERLDNAHDVDIALSAEIRPLVAGTVDMFYLAALKLLSEAYEIKAIVDTKRGVDKYMKTVMNAMHSATNP